MKKEPLVYVIVLNYCSLQDTLECLKRTKDSSYKNLKIIVLDNDSPDSSGKVLGAKIPSSEFTQLNRNTGYAEGNNIGIRAALRAGADYILILNPDIRIKNNSITEYVNIFEGNGNIGALNPIQLASDGQTVDPRFSWMIYGDHLSLKELSTKKYELFSSPTLLGASIMFSRHAIEITGGFDPLYFAYGEELDLCRRLRYHKFELVVTNKCPVIHLRTHENSGTSDFVLFLRLKGIYLNELKNPNRAFILSVSAVLKRLFNDTRNGNAAYAHPFKRKHYVKVFIWLIWNTPNIFYHLHLDKRGKAYLG